MENTNFNKKSSVTNKWRNRFPPFVLLYIILFSSIGCTKTIIKEKQYQYSTLEHYTSGVYYQLSNEDSLAVEEFKKALNDDPENPEILSELAFSLSRLKKFLESEKYARRAIENGSDNNNLYIILGNREKERGNIKKAVSFYKKALADTSNYYLVINLAQLLRELDAFDDAIGLLKTLKIRYPLDLRVHTQLGDLYGRKEKFDQAVLEFQETLVIDSLYYPAILGLGIIYEIKGDIDNAVQYYEKASSLNPNNINLSKRIVEFYLLKGAWEKAKENALTILKISPTENIVRKQLAYAYYRSTDYENALEQYLLLSGLIPRDAAIHHFLGRLYYRKEEKGKAEEEFNQALALNQDFIPNLEYLYIINLKKNNKEKISILEEKLKAKGIKTEEIFSSVGTNLYREKNYHMAKSLFLKSIAVNPNFSEAWYSLAFTYDKLNNLDSTEYAYRKVIELDSTNANGFNALGYFYIEHSMKLEEAERLIKHALEMEPLNGYFIDSLGWLYFKLKNYEKAKELLIKALEQAKDPIIYEHLGDVYEKLGDKEKANQMWQQSFKLKPQKSTQ